MLIKHSFSCCPASKEADVHKVWEQTSADSKNIPYGIMLNNKTEGSWPGKGADHSLTGWASISEQ